MDLDGRKVLVVGMARTGLATAKFLKAKGSIVSTTEMKPKEEMIEAIQELDRIEIQMEWNGHQTETFLKPDLIVVSPGVDLHIEPIQKALKKGIQVISEIELAYHFIRIPIIAVTGTNGKTTTMTSIAKRMYQSPSSGITFLKKGKINLESWSMVLNKMTHVTRAMPNWMGNLYRALIPIPFLSRTFL